MLSLELCIVTRWGGELHGLTRVRGFTQMAAHIFCRPDQVKDEFKKVIDLVLFVCSRRWVWELYRPSFIAR